MAFPQLKIEGSYWHNLKIEEGDIEYLYNFLFEKETPLLTAVLARAMIKERIANEINSQKSRQKKLGTTYLPKDKHKIGEHLVFPALNWEKGVVKSLRDGKNPDLEPFKIIEVEFENGKKRAFASELEAHILNAPQQVNVVDPSLDEVIIFNKFGKQIVDKLEKELLISKDLVRIGTDWFPKSLIIDFNLGHLNLAEAVLDMHNGGPLDPKELLEQIEADVSENPELSEFSLNFALQEDERFDEVGTEGVFSWFLRRNEPESVREIPQFLQYTPIEFDADFLTKEMLQIQANIDDELIQSDIISEISTSSNAFVLNFPHWRVGSIPLTPRLSNFFPTAIETQRVKITIIDKDTDQEISAWVVRPYHYVYGLREWYEERDLIPGSIINLETSDDPGKVYIQPQKRRSNREWIKTILVGVDGGIVIALLKQPVAADFQERMAIVVPDVNSIDQIWKERTSKPKSLKSDALKMMQALAKLNPQRHVHFLELYAAINVFQRCPPGPIMSLLASEQEFNHVGDHYYHLKDAK